MPDLPDSVQPGDLITAAHFNQLRLFLQSLDARVSSLEAAQEDEDALVILNILPTGVIRTGDEMTILGRNFGTPDENVLRIAGVQVTQFKPGSDDTVLILDVPPIAGLSPNGQVVTLTLSNPRGFVSEEIFLQPGTSSILTASFNITYVGQAEPGDITPGDSHVFLFNVVALTSRAASYGLSATCDQGWQAVVVAEDGSVVSPPLVTIPQSPPPEGTTRTFGVRVSVPEDAESGTVFQVGLGISAVENPLQAGGRTMAFEVGAEPEEPSTAIVVSTEFVIPPGQRVGDIVQVPVGATAVVRLQVEVEQEGEYEVQTPEVEGDPNARWTAALQVADPSFPLAPGQSRPVDLTLSPAAGAPNATLRVVVVRTDGDTPDGVLLQPIRILTSA